MRLGFLKSWLKLTYFSVHVDFQAEGQVDQYCVNLILRFYGNFENQN